jgi:hypothetical protein
MRPPTKISKIMDMRLPVPAPIRSDPVTPSLALALSGRPHISGGPDQLAMLGHRASGSDGRLPEKRLGGLDYANVVGRATAERHRPLFPNVGISSLKPGPRRVRRLYPTDQPSCAAQPFQAGAMTCSVIGISTPPMVRPTMPEPIALISHSATPAATGRAWAASSAEW